jgi:cellulose synthase/poly-beta-1,6-N-acetylglucosamine synthase-like glycosyltransferase
LDGLVFVLFLVIGAVGLSAATWLFPVMAFFVVALGSKKGRTTVEAASNDRRQRLDSLAVLIPVRNQAGLLATTLQSVEAAINALRLEHPTVRTSLLIGLDGPSPDCYQVASRFGAKVVHLPQPGGKWSILRCLVEAADAQWIALVDAGTSWPENLLKVIYEKAHSSRLIGIAPSYRVGSGAGFLNYLWRFEAFLKSLENFSGGPISVHGATVFYRLKPLEKLLADLEQFWWNDDVVIPLGLRLQNRDSQIEYLPQLSVQDLAELRASGAAQDNRSEFYRRQRMTVGNLQWLQLLFGAVWRADLTLSLLMLRRLFRLCWFYWLLAFAVGTLGAAAAFSSMSLLLLPVLLAIGYKLWRPKVSLAFASVVAAAINSLCVPLYLLRLNKMEVVWR